VVPGKDNIRQRWKAKVVPVSREVLLVERVHVHARFVLLEEKGIQTQRPVHLIITMIKLIRTTRLSIKNSLSCS